MRRNMQWFKRERKKGGADRTKNNMQGSFVPGIYIERKVVVKIKKK